jgi:spermidine synthase
MKYDLVIADIFKSRVVPAFVTTEIFLTQCRRSVNPGGHIVINYMVNNDKEWRAAIAAINAVFPGNRVINHGINRIIIATV